MKSTPEHSRGAIILKNFSGKICWTFREEHVKDPEHEKIVSILERMGLTLKEAKEMGMQYDEPDDEVFGYLVMQCVGTYYGREIDFFVDFGKDFTDSEVED